MKKANRKEKTVRKTKAVSGTAPKKITTGYFFIPFLITVISLAIESCLVFNGKTGIVGAWIYNVFIGVFGVAGYFIPAGALAIAFFFNSIAENKTVVYKCVTFTVFSAFLSALNSILSFDALGTSPINVPDYFVKGYSGEGGGVVGGIVGKLMAVSFGSVLSIILTVIVCIISLSLFIGTTKAGIWVYLKEMRMFGAEKTAHVKAPKKAPEKISSKESAAAKETAEKSERVTEEKNDFGNTVNVPSVLGRPSVDPFRFGSEVGMRGARRQTASIDLRAPERESGEIKDIYSEETETSRARPEIKISTPTVQGTSGGGRAYSPFADPFIKRDEFMRGSVKTEEPPVAPPPARPESRAYSPFADPFTKREEFIRRENGADSTSAAVKVAESLKASESRASDTALQSPFLSQPVGLKAEPERLNTVTEPERPRTVPTPITESSIPVKENIPPAYERKIELNTERSAEVSSEQKTVGLAPDFFDVSVEKKEKDIAPWEAPVKSAASLNTSLIGDEYTEDADEEDEGENEDYESGDAPQFNAPPISTQSFANAYRDRYNAERQAAVAEQKTSSDTGAYRDHSEKFYPNYVYPSSVLLEQRSSETTVTEEDVLDVQNKLLGKLASFKIEASLVGYSAGPSITRYELAPGPGVTVKAITNRIEDIALELQSDGVRIATVPGKSVIGIEVPNKKVSVVSLRSLIENRDFMDARSKITVCVGLTVTGKPIYMDIDDMPHVLIAGQTKSGKSVAINCMLLSLLYRTTPDEVQLILIDPKRVELNIYSKVPHLVMPVIDDPQRAAAALRWAVVEMERRYEMMDNLGVRNRDEYYELKEQDPSLEYLPQIVIVIDELADLMLQVREHVETLINRLAAKARACGIHLLVGTQRPSVDIVTGLIKANIPARISFQVSSSADSRIILGAVGAEKLLGRGDMLYQATGAGRLRVQGAFVSSGEIKRVTKFIIDNNGEAEFDPEVMRQLDIETDKINKTNKKAPAEDSDSGSYVDSSEADFEYICKAMEYVFESGTTTTNNIQRRLRIGFNRAADIVDALENLGFISKRNGSRPRDILIDPESFEQWRMRNAP